jgi:hypothetical protein
VFVLDLPDAAEAAEAARRASQSAAPAPRRGEYLSAPFHVAETRWAQSGRVGRRIDDAGPSLHNSARLQLADDVEITPPQGKTLAVGDQLVAVLPNGVLSPTVGVGLPTGTLQVTRADPGKPVRAVVRSQTGVIEQGQALFVLDGAAAPVDQRPARVEGKDLESVVSWIEPTSLLPTVQSFLLLAAGEAQGVKAGDEFALVQRSATTGEDRIAVLRVVRVSALGSSAIVVGQSRPGIEVGTIAKRIRRMP